MPKIVISASWGSPFSSTFEFQCLDVSTSNFHNYCGSKQSGQAAPRRVALTAEWNVEQKIGDWGRGKEGFAIHTFLKDNQEAIKCASIF